MHSRKKTAISNINAGFINRVVHLLFQFIIRTVMIRTLGSEYLGLSSLFTSILQVLNVAELGFGNAVVFSMYKPFAEKDYERIGALLKFYRKTYYILGSIIFISGAILTPFLKSLIRGDCPADVNLYILYYVYLFNTSLGYFLYAYKMSLFVADQRDYMPSNIKSIANVLMYLAQIVVLLTVRNYYVYIVFLPIATIAINISQELFARRDYPQIKCEGVLSDSDKTDLKKQVTGLLSYKIGGVVYENADIVVISSFIGLIELAKYTNYYYVITGLNALFAIVQSAMTSTIGNGIVTDSLKDNVRRFDLLTAMYNWIVGLATVFCVCLFQPFMTLWMGSENLLPTYTVFVLCFYFYLCNFQPAVLIYKNAAGIWWQDKIRPILSACANIILNLIFVRVWGINGVIYASISTALFINIPFTAYFLFKNYLRVNLFKYLAEKILFMFSSIAFCAATYFICNLIPEYSSFTTLIIRFLICLIIPNGFFILLLLFTKKLKPIISFVRSVISVIFHKSSRGSEVL